MKKKDIETIIYKDGTKVKCSQLSESIDLYILDALEFELFKILIEEKYNYLKEKRNKDINSICELKFKYARILYNKYIEKK